MSNPIAIFVLLFIFLVCISIACGVAFKKFIKPASGFNKIISLLPHTNEIDADIKKTVTQPFNDFVYEKLTTYFCEGVWFYKNKYSSLIVYPGHSGTRGLTVEGLEGFARTSTLLACWIKATDNKSILLMNKHEANNLDHLLLGLKNGTNPNSSGYWGDFTDNDQRIVEAADIAITLFELSCYRQLNDNLIKSVCTWLQQVNSVNSYEGNWLLFRIVINLVLRHILAENKDKHLDQASHSWKTFSAYHVKNGWFTDGTQGKIDYYNVWQMQYMLFWITRIAADFNNDFIKECLVKFSDDYQYFMSKKGVPIYGRSCSYRFAASVPFLCKALTTCKSEDLRFAHKANENIWRFYASKNGLQSGNMTQGYFAQDVDLLENYSGRASSLWGLRSLSLSLLAFYDKPIDSSDVKMPVELGDFEVNFKSININVKGYSKTGEVVVSLNQNKDNKLSIFNKRSLSVRILEKILHRPLRIENFEAKYNNPQYSNLTLFFNRQANRD
jgi:hypothetical protein